MLTRPTLARLHGFTRTAAAALSLLMALGIVSAVSGMFRPAGRVLEQIASAEHACASHAFASERQTCVRRYLGTAQARKVARG